MNVAITTYIRYSGPVSELDPILKDISGAVIRNGYGVDVETDSLVSLITVTESPIGSFDDVNDFAKAVVRDAITVIVPTNMTPEEVKNAERSID